MVLAGIGIASATRKNPAENVTTETVAVKDLVQTVLATGQVVSQTDLNLSFKASGSVRKVAVKVGQRVKEGDVLANLDQKDQAAALTSARGGLASANANYRRVLDGASSEEVQVAQAAVTLAQVTLDSAKKSLQNTKQQQQILVDNAYRSLLNSSPEAAPASSNLSGGSIAVSGQYADTQEGTYTIRVGSNGARFDLLGLESGTFDLTKGQSTPLGTRGLEITFSNASYINGEIWTIDIPNKQASTYTTNLNAYNAALETQRSSITAAENAVASAQASVDQAIASLNLKKAAARPADVASAQAQVLSAQGQVQTAEAALENTIIRAPSNGTITKVDIKVGEQATALKPVVILQDPESLHIEANISEANVTNLRTGQKVTITLDAVPEKEYLGEVQFVDPASTVVSGVVNYKVTVTLNKSEEIKPGMTANLSILVAEKQNAVAVPLRAVIQKNGNGKVVRVVTDAKKKTYEERKVVTGLEADGGMVEIVSGVSVGDEIVTLVKDK